MMGMELDKKALKDIMKGMGKLGGGKPKAMSVSVEKVGKVPHGMEEIKEEKVEDKKDRWPEVKDRLAEIKNKFSELEAIIGEGYYKEEKVEEKEEIED